MWLLTALAFAEPPTAAARVVDLANEGDFRALLKAEVARARADGLVPYLEFTAPWCKPCVAFDKYIDDPQMQDARAGTHLIRASYDHWAREADAMGVRGVPTWLALDADLRPTRAITSSSWGEDIPANMAPVLKAFFHP